MSNTECRTADPSGEEEKGIRKAYRVLISICDNFFFTLNIVIIIFCTEGTLERQNNLAIKKEKRIFLG